MFGCGKKARYRAYGQPVCRYHRERCLTISNAERVETKWRRAGRSAEWIETQRNYNKHTQLADHKYCLRSAQLPDKLPDMKDRRYA